MSEAGRVGGQLSRRAGSPVRVRGEEKKLNSLGVRSASLITRMLGWRWLVNLKVYLFRGKNAAPTHF